MMRALGWGKGGWVGTVGWVGWVGKVGRVGTVGTVGRVGWVVWLVLAAVPLAAQETTLRGPVLVQGAMTSETERFVGRLEQPRLEQIGNWSFWHGSIDGYPVVVSKTNKGMSNAAAATALAIERFHPIAIFNQGTSGGHDPDLRVYDIVLGTASLNVGAFRALFRKRGEGSRPLEWVPLDLLAEGSAISPDAPKRPARFDADPALLGVAREVRATYTRGRVVDGVIGSSDMWIDELDRVALFHSAFGTSVEEMETASAAQVAAAFGVPFLGIRVLSDNITNGSRYDARAGEACEDFVFTVVTHYVARLAK
ncbi:MAG TPA: 5'-methylthioadenosine/S-adenosylhomocysteine nucleosidase [Vicinamibacterales bacterium]|nr:5'-methylthioadenosine/S-adenosylhomocysteine nucleosidase [Vicinamibacterales bacterium]